MEIQALSRVFEEQSTAWYANVLRLSLRRIFDDMQHVGMDSVAPVECSVSHWWLSNTDMLSIACLAKSFRETMGG